MPEDFKAGFLKTLWILRDYLSVIVIGGGWVPLLYYHYLLADKSREPMRTRDIDLLVDVQRKKKRGQTNNTHFGAISVFLGQKEPYQNHN